MKRMNFPSRVEKRREEAQERKAIHDARTPQEQLEILIDKGFGNCAEAKEMKDKISAGYKQTLGGDSWPKEEEEVDV